MYSLSDIRTLHLEITSRCQASCPMCARNLQGGVENPWVVIDEVTLDTFKEWFSVEFLKQLTRLYMCGNLGDPVVASDTVLIFKYLREINPTINLSMNTNGSARSKAFWQELAELGVSIRFGIDGLEDTHALYRVGTDWKKIIDNATTFINNGGYAIWDMLVFEHNLHQVNQCKQMSIDLGFKEFYSKNTSRFRDDCHHVLDKDGRTTHILYPSIKSQSITKSFQEYNLTENKVINCKALAEKSIYINSQGEVSPCCWLDFTGVPPISPAKVDFLDNNFKNHSLKTQTLSEIFNTDYFSRVEATWKDRPLKQCSKQCGQIDKLNIQFKD